jgi:hypothetical protein
MPILDMFTGPLDVQLIKSSGGVRWGATYSAPFLESSATQFKAKSD